jgi:DNA-binding beta-propeller fold protein YncE
MKTEKSVLKVESSKSFKISDFFKEFGDNAFSDVGEALLNGVAILGDRLVLVLGGWNVVVSIDPNEGIFHLYGGKEGVGRNKLKEPVAVSVSPKGQIFIADWHNHRLVRLDKNFEFLSQFGSYGSISNEGAFFRFLRYLKLLASSGSYIGAHFVSETGKRKRQKKSVGLFLEGFTSGVLNNSEIFSLARSIFSKNHVVNKPNGIAFFDDKIVITQKNNRCISVYEDESPYKLVRHVVGPKEGVFFGRLGNIHFFNKNFYVCDERAGKVWKLTKDFKFIEGFEGQSSGTEEDCFMPFSCCMLDGIYLSVCGGHNFQIINTETREIVYVSESYGELHGIAYDDVGKNLYIADRLTSCIHVLSVSLYE